MCGRTQRRGTLLRRCLGTGGHRKEPSRSADRRAAGGRARRRAAGTWTGGGTARRRALRTRRTAHCRGCCSGCDGTWRGRAPCRAGRAPPHGRAPCRGGRKEGPVRRQRCTLRGRHFGGSGRMCPCAPRDQQRGSAPPARTLSADSRQEYCSGAWASLLMHGVN